MKKCAKCKLEKDELNFSKRKISKDGLHPYCKICVSNLMKNYWKKDEVKKRVSIWRCKNKEKVKIYSLKCYRKNKEKRLKEAKEYRIKNRKEINENRIVYYWKNRDEILLKNSIIFSSGKGKKYANEYYHKNKIKFNIKINARNKLRYAVRTGKIIKSQSCEDCGKSDCLIDGHHENYEEPLKVKWLCRICHRKVEKQRVSS